MSFNFEVGALITAGGRRYGPGKHTVLRRCKLKSQKRIWGTNKSPRPELPSQKRFGLWTLKDKKSSTGTVWLQYVSLYVQTCLQINDRSEEEQKTDSCSWIHHASYVSSLSRIPSPKSSSSIFVGFQLYRDGLRIVASGNLNSFPAGCYYFAHTQIAHPSRPLFLFDLLCFRPNCSLLL